MPSRDETRALQQILRDLRAAATGDLTAIWRLTVGMNTTEAAEIMVEAFAQIIGQFISSAAQVAAIWYDDLAPGSRYRARPSSTINDEQLRRSARWAMAPMFTPVRQPAPVSDDLDRATAAAEEFERSVRENRDPDRAMAAAEEFERSVAAERDRRTVEDSDAQQVDEPAFGPGDEGTGSPLERMLGAAERHINNAARQTITENAEQEGVRWARHAEPDACAFCRMMATRGAVYLTEANAAQVTGGTGRQLRGTRKLGESYHDWCNCIAVPSREGNPYIPPEYVDDWTDEYYEAKDATNGTFRQILQVMRTNDPDRPKKNAES